MSQVGKKVITKGMPPRPAEMRAVWLGDNEVISWPWQGGDGLARAKAHMQASGGRVAVGVYFHNPDRTIEHRFDFDLMTGQEIE